MDYYYIHAFSLAWKNDYRLVVSIFSKDTIQDTLKISNTNKWLKHIDTKYELSIVDFEIEDIDFVHVADIVLDNELTRTGKKRRTTLIKFEPSIEGSCTNISCIRICFIK